jgi:hypothetical protein
MSVAIKRARSGPPSLSAVASLHRRFGVGDHDPGAFTHKAGGDPFADAPRSTDDERHAPCEAAP